MLMHKTKCVAHFYCLFSNGIVGHDHAALGFVSCFSGPCPAACEDGCSFGPSALFFCCLCCFIPRMISLTVQTMKDREGKTPLHWAASCDNVDVARVLLRGLFFDRTHGNLLKVRVR
jgi:hypothetical protein